LENRETNLQLGVKILPFLVIHKVVRGMDTNFASLRSGPQPRALLDTLGISGYSAIYVDIWLEPHQDKFPALTFPKHYVPLKDIWPEIIWDNSDDEGGLPEPLKPTRVSKRHRQLLLDPHLIWTQVKKSADKLFFIHHAPANSMVAKWCLVDVLPATVEASAEDTGIYTVG
jgi:hypothetical protein